MLAVSQYRLNISKREVEATGTRDDEVYEWVPTSSCIVLAYEKQILVVPPDDSYVSLCSGGLRTNGTALARIIHRER